MFNPFKRSVPASAKPVAKPVELQASGTPAPIAPGMPYDATLPEVVEGNEQTDWALWEEPVNVLGSQMQGLTPSAKLYESDNQTPSEYQDLNPFARVNRKSR
jgi:hypothetical protein